MSVQPYLFFEGRCEEALEFYKKTLGAKVDMLMRYKDAPPGAEPKAEQCGGVVPPADKVMHAAFRIGDAVVMASDGMVSGKSEFKGFSLSVDVADKAAAERTFKALGDGGQVTMPLTETFFANAFGMLVDRFGVGWMVIAPKPM
ncbi:VOC family protein [uncultured Ralstonia sp.]|jgi:PhnB protein|uniref:VOC family protein n=1 Tax=Ralstonia sp. TaxID=54061 RepID=UPI001EA4DCBB|nr:VOC family protein [uncultured Ralstonia sp.]UCF25257.1 MAG: VOC family protein [Ralstonia sp.]